ncbi:hypothetical protein FA10DRAFT_224706 [Acaromyces ingoldii]|uniref:CAP-Gly domain-containing protein n=1 Tax=Acaromyces ingoldii TaxID=215250 RepID=A0A316YXG8_9BASI|nr:hypothetical protein FA10DRAFT_224706 [Acaromyces ingoldii]PWN93959.1 hypothetical protein FA10DRAFT_224706 [Acaromyces ingoldii]
MPTVLLVVHCPTVPIVSERRLASTSALSEVCARIELLSGIPSDSQRLSLWSGRTDDADARPGLVHDFAADGLSCEASMTLEQCGARDGMGLKVLDTRASEIRHQFGQEEEEKVEKYEMDDEVYAQRQDSVLAYKQRMKMGRFGEAAASATSDVNDVPDLPSNAQPGARCQVIEGERRGTIRFVGPTAFAPGTWIGIEYDEPVGKNDGSIKGHRYFSAKPSHGGFVKPDKVDVGAFPVRRIADNDDDDDDDIDDDNDEM